jgi:hypothetical protein
VDDLAVSIACLQVAGRVALPCGVEAAVLKALRCASKLDFKPGAACGAFAAIVVKHASYFLMYSSHSATPVPGSLASAFVSLFAAEVFAGAVLVVVVVVVVVVFAGLFVVVVVVVLVAAPPHPKETTANVNAAAIAIKFLNFISSEVLPK